MGSMVKKLAAAAARHKMQNNAAAALEKQEREAQLSRTLLYHLMRKEGRVRISQADIAALKEADTVDFEVDDDHGMILATYRVG
jgi:CRISPR/Cas system-associated exonuclease Cas4 (RecB family)